MTRVLWFCVLALILAGCGGGVDGGDSSPAVVDNERTIGNPLVYARIERLTSCTALQEEFDIAGDNADREHKAGRDADVPQSYMSAADNRMREIGCYG